MCRELEAAFDEERDACKAEKSKVSRLEESLGSEKKKLQEEIDEKLQIITDLSKQLEVHQKNFDALKMELTQVNVRVDLLSFLVCYMYNVFHLVFLWIVALV